MNLKDFLVNSARLFPNKTAVKYRDRSLSYQEFYRNSRSCGSALRDMGVKKGDCICIAARNCIEYLEVVFGCTMLGAVPCLINWRLSPEATAGMVEEAHAKVLFISNTERNKAEYLRINGLGKDVRVIIICEDANEPYDYDQVRNNGSEALVFEETSDQDTGMILFTSGTTGSAKGVILSNKALVTQVCNTVICARWCHDERFLCVSPICHSISLAVMAVFCVGGTLILCPLEYLKDYGKMFDFLEEECVTRMALVPTVIEQLIGYAEERGIKNDSLRVIGYGAAPMNTQLILRCKKIFSCNFHQGYGMTEAYGSVTALLPEDHDCPELLGSVGRPMTGVSLRILDENGKALPAGKTGEIAIKAETLMEEYLGMPELTAQVLADGWYCSGDIGYVNEAGYLFLTDRKSAMIITGGENVFPSEIENCIRTMSPEVREVSVAGIPDPVWGEIVVAAVVRESNSHITESEIMDYCRKRLGSFKKPKRILFVDALPVNHSGKVSRAMVKSLFM